MTIVVSFDLKGLPKAAGQSGWGKLMASFQSADDMLDEVNFCVSCLAPLGGPRVAAALRKVRMRGSALLAFA